MQLCYYSPLHYKKFALFFSKTYYTQVLKNLYRGNDYVQSDYNDTGSDGFNPPAQ